MAKIYRNRDWLWEQYIIQEKSSVATAQEAGCDPKTIYRWLHRYGIPIRSRGEAIFLALRNSVIITPDFLEFLRGEIIGDGCVRIRPSNRSALYEHSSAYEKYLIWLSERFDGWGIEQVGRITDYKDKETGKIYYHYTSRAYPELVPIYKHWYTKRDGKMKKTVPQDLELTPIMARQWYLGDGGFDSYTRKRPGIKLSTCSFDQQSIEHLIEELTRLGFKATHQPSDNKIYLSVYSVLDFLAWIGPCPVACYQYKWGYLKNA